ncbi:hypothetical protein KKF69_08170 [Patescibacteria group bacterium]|nr:hypothetical protein [Patescibacteria group bacterium]
MKKIKKINQLNNVESFIQADFVKGYRYIDRAGELVNKFHLNSTPPKFAMNLDGLVIIMPDSNIKEIKISSLSFWAHFLKPDSLDQARQLFEQKLKVTNKVLEPEGYSRLGWRNYFIYEVNKDEKEVILKRLVPSGKFDFKQLVFSVKLGSFENNISINPALKNNDANFPAVLFDVDTFIKYEQVVDINRIERDLKSIKETISGDLILEVINRILGRIKEQNGRIF